MSQHAVVFHLSTPDIFAVGDVGGERLVGGGRATSSACLGGVREVPMAYVDVNVDAKAFASRARRRRSEAPEVPILLQVVRLVSTLASMTSDGSNGVGRRQKQRRTKPVKATG